MIFGQQKNTNQHKYQLFPKKKIKQKVNVLLFSLYCEHPKYQRISIFDTGKPFINNIILTNQDYYQANQERNLSTSEKDVILMKSIFSSSQQYDIKTIFCHKNSIYDLNSILELIQTNFNDNTSSATILYFSGQGEKDTGNIIIEDNHLMIDKITFQNIYDLWEGRKSQQQLCHLILDCSYSGFWVKAMQTQHSTNYQFTVYASCSEKQISRETETGGIFTKNLVIALSDNKQNINQLNDQFEKKNIQNPQFFGMYFKVHEFIGLPLFFLNVQKMQDWINHEDSVEEIQEGRQKGDKYIGEVIYQKKPNIPDLVKNALILEKQSQSLEKKKFFYGRKSQSPMGRTSNDWKRDQQDNQRRLHSADTQRGRLRNTFEKTKKVIDNSKSNKSKDSINQKKTIKLRENKNKNSKIQKQTNKNPQQKEEKIFAVIKKTLPKLYNAKLEVSSKPKVKPQVIPSEDKKNYQSIKEGQGYYLYYHVIRQFSGQKYEGGWKNNQKSGLGTMYYENGDIYEGEWVDDKMQGFGFFYTVQGNVYQGQWKDNKKYGKGILLFKDGDQYDGQWEHDEMQGIGKFIYQNKDIYEGMFHKGLKHGVGIYIYENGDKYEGEWKYGKKDGKGIFWWNSGQWQGDRYEGTWKKGLKQGSGIYYYSNGDKFQGNWDNDKMSGDGVFTWSDGEQYVGQFKESLRCGKGSQIFSNGEKQQGYFKLNCPMGRHIVYNQEGKLKEKKEFGHQQ